mmetsp:Transcript_254/g.954  ORF Transcript_254/g.954 Transcript_254/m.954 type:complete len:271 (+) Transcript_254:1944-2756(+)
MVADIRTSLSGAMPACCFLLYTMSLIMARSRSLWTVLSCTSSITTWDTLDNRGSPISFLSRMPVVQKSSLVSEVVDASSLTWYPTRDPLWPGGGSSRSEATLSATLTAAILLGCVHTTKASSPFSSLIRLSRMNWGTWVVFPDPVSPQTIKKSLSTRASEMVFLISLMGKGTPDLSDFSLFCSSSSRVLFFGPPRFAPPFLCLECCFRLGPPALSDPVSPLSPVPRLEGSASIILATRLSTNWSLSTFCSSLTSGSSAFDSVSHLTHISL